MVTKVSNAGRELIKALEGSKSRAYKCSAGYWTIGVGHKITAKDTNLESVIGREATYNILNEKLDEQEISALLAVDLQDFVRTIVQVVGTKLKPNEFDAVASLAFNIGANAFKRSTLAKKINSGSSPESIALEFLKWSYVGKTINRGLLKRRYVEAAAFLGSFPKATKNQIVEGVDLVDAKNIYTQYVKDLEVLDDARIITKNFE
jgi:lysozyme